MKIWRFDYECGGLGRSGTVHLTGETLLEVCQDFTRFWANRQATDTAAEAAAALVKGRRSEAYWGPLLCVKVWPWAPYKVAADGNLESAKTEAEHGMEWKIDGSAAGFTFLEWAKHEAKRWNRV